MKVKITKNNFNHVVNVELEVSKEALENASKEARTLKDKDGKAVFLVEQGSRPSVSEVGMTVPAVSFAYTVEGATDKAVENTRRTVAKTIAHVTAIEKQINKEYDALLKAAEKVVVE